MIRAARDWLGRIVRDYRAIDAAKSPTVRLPGGTDRWIEHSMAWFVEQFGAEVLRMPIMRPSEFIPAGYDGTLNAARGLSKKVCERMGVPVDQVYIWFDMDDVLAKAAQTHEPRKRTVCGLWVEREDRNAIAISSVLLAHPTQMVATLAHELAHELLIGSGRITPERPDQEHLADLLTVFYGFGIFAANAAFEWQVGDDGCNVATSHGYLRESGLRDALAYYAFARGESTIKPWVAELDPELRRVTGAKLALLRERHRR